MSSPTATCTECRTSFDRQLFTRVRRGRKESFYGPRTVCSRRCERTRQYKSEKARGNRPWEDETDYCPVCEFAAANTDALAVHMKETHKRLILDYDMNRAFEDRQERYRRIQAEEDDLLGIDNSNEVPMAAS